MDMLPVSFSLEAHPYCSQLQFFTEQVLPSICSYNHVPWQKSPQEVIVTLAIHSILLQSHGSYYFLETG